MIRLLLIVCSCALLLPNQSLGDIIHLEDFEDDTGYVTSTPEFTNNSTRYFVRSNFLNINNNVNYNTVQGSFFFGAQEVGAVTPVPVSLSINNIDISGESTLFFSGLFAEDNDTVFFEEDWDADDYLHVSYQIDGGGFQNLFWIESAGASNTVAQVDTDFDGIGDGAEITDTFTQYIAAISGTGSSLDLLIEISLDAREEDIAFDNLAIHNSLPTSGGVPEPGMLGLLGLLTLSLAARRRRK
jgi:hypothetical protein